MITAILAGIFLICGIGCILVILDQEHHCKNNKGILHVSNNDTDVKGTCKNDDCLSEAE